MPKRVTRQTSRTNLSDTTASVEHSESDFQDLSESDPESDYSPTTFDGFSSEKAKGLFEKHKNKPTLPERGFNEMTVRQHEFIRWVITKQKWAQLCKVHHSYNLTLVRDFYAEAGSRKSTTIRVIGVKVDYSAETINDLFDLHPPSPTDFDELMEKTTREELDAMITVLGQPETNWSFNDNYMLRTFKASCLTPNANVWMNFIRHTLSPTTHDSSIKTEHILMLHCIMEGKTLNMGDIIVKRIKYCAG